MELTTLKQKLVRKKNRKLRRLRELYPAIRIKLFYARDFRMLLLKFGRLALLDELTGTTGQSTPPRIRRGRRRRSGRRRRWPSVALADAARRRRRECRAGRRRERRGPRAAVAAVAVAAGRGAGASPAGRGAAPGAAATPDRNPPDTTPASADPPDARSSTAYLARLPGGTADPTMSHTVDLDADIGEVLLTEAEIAAKIAELGRRISEDYAGRNLTLVSVLKGSLPFMADLMRQISLPLRIDLMEVSSYGGTATESSGLVRIIKDLSASIADEDVLLVEDIIDTGLTLNYLVRYLRGKNPASLRICTLLDKPARRLVDIPVDYVGFEIPDQFVVGYGLDYGERYRNLRFVGVLRPEVYSAPSSRPDAPSSAGHAAAGWRSSAPSLADRRLPAAVVRRAAATAALPTVDGPRLRRRPGSSPSSPRSRRSR